MKAREQPGEEEGGIKKKNRREEGSLRSYWQSAYRKAYHRQQKDKLLYTSGAWEERKTQQIQNAELVGALK